MPRSISSNSTGLQFAREVYDNPGLLPGESGLPGTAVWEGLEPNSYSDFGGQNTLTQRSPIVATRQKRKGRKTDQTANANFQLDFTGNNMVPFMEGFMCAAWYQPGVVEAPTSVSATQYVKTGAVSGLVVNNLILASGFSVAGNNGVKTVTAFTSDNISAAGLSAEASPPATAKIEKVGYRAAAGVISVTSATFLSTGAVDATTLGLRPGQWFYVGGDTPAENFATAANNGWARVRSVAAGGITVDKTQNTWAADTGTGKTISLWYGKHIWNEPTPADIKYYTYQFERFLTTGVYEYVRGSYASELTLTLAQADKITADLGFLSLSAVTQATAKPGTRRGLLTDAEAFNTATDLVRLRCSARGSATPLVSYLRDLNLTVNNNVTILKALGVLGGFDASFGGFQVTGTVNAYFSDLASVTAVNNSTSLTVDFAMCYNNRGWLFDLPLFVGEGGTLEVALDQPVNLPLGIQAAQDDTLGVTLIANYFPYLPNVAMPV